MRRRRGVDGQIRATKELGWTFIESRAIDGKNIHDNTDMDFDRVLREARGGRRSDQLLRLSDRQLGQEDR